MNAIYYSMAFKHVVKIILVGEAEVGKSSLMVRFTDKVSMPTEYTSTLGVDFRVVNDHKASIKTQIWDTAGAERFRSITNAYYRSANAAILAFDLTRRSTFITLEQWLDDIKRYGNDRVKVILVGCKTDLPVIVSEEEINLFAQKHNLKYYSCSSKNNLGVDHIFNDLIKNLIKEDNTGTCLLTEATLNDQSSSGGRPWWCSIL